MEKVLEYKKTLEKRKRDLQHQHSKLETLVANDIKEIKGLKKELFEVTVARIAMGEIMQASRESLFRHMGYVKSFHGYPDMAEKPCRDCKHKASDSNDT